MRLLTLLLVLAVNAVPIYGALRLGWSAPTLLVLYWCENAMAIVFTSLRIWLHRRLTRKRGHWNTKASANVGNSIKAGDRTTLLAAYAIPSAIFTAAHAIFVAAIAFGIASNHPGDPFWRFSLEQLWTGLQWMLAVMAVDFAKDLFGLRSWSYAAMKRYSDQRMGRVIVQHLGIIFGMFALAMVESPLAPLAVLIGLKALLDAAWSWAGDAEAVVPEEPPAWALAAARKVGKLGKPGAETSEADFRKQWREQRETERRDAIENELPMES